MIKKYKVMFIGTVMGALISLFLLIGQRFDILFYLTGAPYYIDAITVNSGKLVSYVTFLYYVLLGSFIGYLINIKSSLKVIIPTILIVILIHGTLVYLGGEMLANGVERALDVWFK